MFSTVYNSTTSNRIGSFNLSLRHSWMASVNMFFLTSPYTFCTSLSLFFLIRELSLLGCNVAYCMIVARLSIFVAKLLTFSSSFEQLMRSMYLLSNIFLSPIPSVLILSWRERWIVEMS